MQNFMYFLIDILKQVDLHNSSLSKSIVKFLCENYISIDLHTRRKSLATQRYKWQDSSMRAFNTAKHSKIHSKGSCCSQISNIACSCSVPNLVVTKILSMRKIYFFILFFTY